MGKMKKANVKGKMGWSYKCENNRWNV